MYQFFLESLNFSKNWDAKINFSSSKKLSSFFFFYFFDQSEKQKNLTLILTISIASVWKNLSN